MVDADLDMAELSARGAQALAHAFGVQARFYYTTQLQKAAFSADAVILCSDFLDEEAWKKDFESLDAVGLGNRFACARRPRRRDADHARGRFVCDLADQMREECPGAPLILCSSGYGGLPLSRACEAAQRFCGVRTLGVSGVTEQDPRAAGALSGVEGRKGGCDLRGAERFS